MSKYKTTKELIKIPEELHISKSQHVKQRSSFDNEHIIEIIKHIKQVKLENPYNYTEFTYFDQEWDNVPPIVPKISFHLEKYVKHICLFIEDLSMTESTAALRESLTK